MTANTPKERPTRVRLIELIDRPLGFYVLSLLIVETFIGVVAGLGRANLIAIQLGLWLGVGMFVYITLTVSIIVWVKPHVLTFDRDAHFRERKAWGPIGSDKHSVKSPEKLDDRPGPPEGS